MTLVSAETNANIYLIIVCGGNPTLGFQTNRKKCKYICETQGRRYQKDLRHPKKIFLKSEYLIIVCVSESPTRSIKINLLRCFVAQKNFQTHTVFAFVSIGPKVPLDPEKILKQMSTLLLHTLKINLLACFNVVKLEIEM